MLDLGDYWLVRFCFRRALGLIYLVAFLVAATQYPALHGEDGILPAADFLDHDRLPRRTRPLPVRRERPGS